jgi:hypothetical protein
MKVYYLVIALTFLSAVVFSQERFGTISPQEANMKVCDFDPEASAVILFREASSDFGGNDELITMYHERIKILKQDGVKKGDFKMSFHSNNDFETMTIMEAVSINIGDDGNRKDLPVDESSIYVKKINKYRSELSFAFPNVKPGTILDLRYRIVAKHYGGIRDWYFQTDIPVVKSSYRLKIVPGHEVSYLVQFDPSLKVDVKQLESNHAIKFEMNNIPALTDEPYMDAKEDYLQKVIFQTTKYADHGSSLSYMSSWKEVTRELISRTDFGKQTKIKIDECQQFIETALNGKSNNEKMQAIHHYVANNLTWDGYYGLTAENGIKNLWKKKSGNSAEINLLLINLLRQAGLEAFPMLVSERGHGRVNKDQPFINQFNNVFAAVLLDNKQYYLDATDRFTPSHITPYSILNSTGFIVDHNVGGLVDIKENAIRYIDNVTISAKLNEAGELSGSASLESKDYARMEKLRNYASHKSDYVDYYIKSGLVNVDVDNFNVKNTEDENLPFAQQFDFKTTVQTTGEYAFLGFNMFTGLHNNPFIVNNRFSNINFGYKKTVNLTYVIDIPKNFKVDELPKNKKLVNGDNSVTMTRQFFHEGGKLMAKINVSVDKTLFGVGEYAGVKDFFKQMVDLMNEQVVLKKI